MKKMSYFLIMITIMFVFSMSASAASLIVITGNEVRFRTEPNTGSNSGTITYLYKGNELTLLDENAGSENGCDGTWYKGKYGSTEGYVCGKYAEIKVVEEINPEDYAEYSEYLKTLGFPDTYIPKLVELHVKHPEWQFKVMNIDLDFNKFISIEYNPNGLSLIEDTGHYFDGYKSFDNWSYNYLTNQFNTKFDGGGDVWYAAGRDTIAYYVDPRNFLDSQHMFMFETLSYNSFYHTIEGVQAMLNGTFMEMGYADEVNQKTFADAFIDAGVTYGVSPYVLVSRVIQEVGPKGSTIVSGTVPGYEGYYNFYNIDAAGKDAKETIENGLIYAKNAGWDTKYKAVIGGAFFLVKDYISKGQDTLYLQKWDVFDPNYGAHQYMQNIQAPYTESVKTYKGYDNMSLVNSPFVFTIPVFKNMPLETKLPNKGNPNNYLLSLSVNGHYLFEKATTETEFSLNLAKDTASIEIAADKVYSKSVVTGTGSVSLSSDEQIIPITVTAQNGDVRIYNIKITRIDEIPLAISEILRLLGIVNDDNYMYGFNVGTDISLIRQNIINREPKAEVTTYDKFGNTKSDGIIASGDVVNIKTANEEKKYKIVVYGDANSDGKITSADYIAIKNHIMEVTKLNEEEQLYGDANKDGKVNSADYIAIKNHIMEVKSIVQ